MLTDIFGIRYEDVPIFRVFSNREKRVLHQGFTMLEEAHPFWPEEKLARKTSEEFWEETHKRVANELGVRYLSIPNYASTGGSRPLIEVTRDFIAAPFQDGDDPDSFIKNRLSVLEVGMRLMYETSVRALTRLDEIAVENTTIRRIHVKNVNRYNAAKEEVNVRFGQGRFPLHYHNGYIQLEKDEMISSEIEQPFWSLVSGEIWQNVDLDMKEALDQLDTGAKDPSFHAGKAFESALKIISSELGVTHGSERSAHSFVDNLGKKSLGFLSAWEAKQIKHYFTEVRNPLGHGPGNEPMPSLDSSQSAWAIEGAMSWIKLIVDRYENWTATQT